MAIKVGDRIPDGTLTEMVDTERPGCSLGPNSFDGQEVTAGKTIAIFGLPGAFTPTCSAKHVPSYVQNVDALKATGVDEIWCVSVNDAFVMALGAGTRRPSARSGCSPTAAPSAPRHSGSTGPHRARHGHPLAPLLDAGGQRRGEGRQRRAAGQVRGQRRRHDAESALMSYDLVIKNGVLIDGSGLPRYHADVAVQDGRIVATGRIRERGARGRSTPTGWSSRPGFIDGHTHMDAQVFWDPLGTCSCYHGVTSVVMGNCGFSLAPCSASAKHLVVRNLQRAEDISRRRWRRASNGAGRRSRSSSIVSKRCPRASTTRATSATARCAPTRWASALSSRRRPRTISRDGARVARCDPGAARSASPPHARRCTRRPTAGRWRAASRPGTRSAGSSA